MADCRRLMKKGISLKKKDELWNDLMAYKEKQNALKDALSVGPLGINSFTLDCVELE